MSQYLNFQTIGAIAKRTFRQMIESPIAYVVAIFFFGFLGGIFSLTFFANAQASVTRISVMAPWILWFVIPALTMGLISDELRTGTFEQLSTLPIRDWEIVLGKYLGFALFALILNAGLIFFPAFVAFLADHPLGLDWGATMGAIGGLYFVSLLFGALGLWASSLAKNQVVSLILGMIFCTFFFFIGQLYDFMPPAFAKLADFLGLLSHLATMSRGVWDFRDLFYFISFIGVALYLTVQRLSTRRF